MTEVIFKFVAKNNLDDIRWLRWLDAEIFPNDMPAVVGTANWFLGWHEKQAVAFCGWKPYLLDIDLVDLVLVHHCH